MTHASRLLGRFPTVAIPILILSSVVAAAPSLAQLPPDAVDLSLVKIPQKIGDDEICPVGLKPSDRSTESWTYEKVNYQACENGEKATFMKDPKTYAASHKREVWAQNFMLAMSSIWCPITDEVTPGGRKQVDGLGYKWESCCSFCDEEMKPDNFREALARLRSRADESYELTGGVYTEGASSPVEGAIKEDF